MAKSENEFREDYIGKVIHNGHTYYAYCEQRQYHVLNQCYIKDDENGVRSGYLTDGKPTAKQIFDYLYESDEYFREYVDTDGKCLEED